MFRGFHLSVYISCITLIFKSNHLNQMLNRSAPYAPADMFLHRELLLSVPFFGDQQEHFLVALTRSFLQKLW